MQENIYERINRTLSWKRIVGFNVVLFLVLIVPISVRLAQQDTENRSSAAEEAPVVTPPPNYPTVPPKIDRVSMFFGKTGDTVVLLGSNFGDYQWGSRVFVGNSEATKESIVRWSNSILEVKIPEGARTGAVWVVVNNQEAKWEGSLLLYDVARAAQIGLQKISNTEGRIYTINGTGAVRGMIEVSYVSEPFTIQPAAGINITAQTPSSDSLGKKIRVNFDSVGALPSSRTELASYSFPGLGEVEIIRAELYDGSGKMLSIFSDPLAIKVRP
ncbi:MAG: IPT/TIG domain-containing protein [bacterium]